jgi:hypothetical protein
MATRAGRIIAGCGTWLASAVLTATLLVLGAHGGVNCRQAAHELLARVRARSREMRRSGGPRTQAVAELS